MSNDKKTETTAHSDKGDLGELFLLCLRMGFLAFGGPAAHIAMLEDEVVRRRKWFTHQEYLDLLGLTNLIPGPNSTEMVIHVGYHRAGLVGMFVAGFSFILPAAFIVGALAWLYVAYGTLPAAEGLLFGVKPVVVVIIVQALWALGKKAIKSTGLAVLALVGIAAVWAGVGELEVLLAGGLITALLTAQEDGWKKHRRGLAVVAAAAALILCMMLLAPRFQATGEVDFTLTGLFLFFLKVGGILYGSGYVLIAFIESALVDQWAWITQGQLLDAVAIGQVTPGPLFTTATFIGFLKAGPVGAAVATVGIFLPAFLFVAILGPLLPRLRKSPMAGAFLDGVNATALSLMAVVTVQLTASSLFDPVAAIIAVVAAVLLFGFKLSATWLIFGGAVLGLALSWVEGF